MSEFWSGISPEAREGLRLFVGFLGFGVGIGVAMTLLTLRCAGVL